MRPSETIECLSEWVVSYLDQGETRSFTCIFSIMYSLELKRTQPMCVCIFIFKCYHVSRDTGM